MKHVKKNVKYAVRKADVRLDITVGSGQIGSSGVSKGDKELASGGSILSVNLGPGTDLKGADVVVESLVQDVLTQTNRVTVQYVLSGGVKKQTFVAKTIVDKDLDMCRFTTTIGFVEAS
jgi:hypothetical protein